MTSKEVKLIEKELVKLYKKDSPKGAYLYFSSIEFEYIETETIWISINFGIEKQKDYKLNLMLIKNASIYEQAYYLLGNIHQFEFGK